MIKNEREYRITRAQLDRFTEALVALEATPPAGAHPRMLKAQKEALQSQADDLKAELGAYEALRRSEEPIAIESLTELPQALIQARIRKGFTQRQLAEALGVKEQQVQRDEQTFYKGVSFDRMVNVMKALGVEGSGSLHVVALVLLAAVSSALVAMA